MKKDIHPDYHSIHVIHTDGSVHEYRSTMGKEGDVHRLDVDYKSHPAWTGGSQQILRAGRLDSFNKKFANFGIQTQPTEKATDKKA
jgi:large subunit ribosomal protein L31